jgi:hypothetical protein
MGQLSNVEVEYSDLKKSGTSNGKNGPFEWNRYSLKINGEYYTYFQSGKKPIIKKGDILLYVEYSEKQNGEYLNKTIEDFKFATQEPQTKPTVGDIQSGKVNVPLSNDIDLRWKFAKNVIELMRISRETGEPLANLIEECKAGVSQMASHPEKHPAWERPVGAPEDSYPEESAEIDDSQIPF